MKQLLILLSLTFIIASCKKHLEIPPPENELLAETVFSDDQSALSAIAGLYSQVMNVNNSFANGATTIYPALSADELLSTNTFPEIEEFSRNELLPSNSLVNTHFWTRAYRLIYHANMIIEQIEKSTALSSGVKNKVKGEALFMRAFLYHYLALFFGDVPLVLNTGFMDNASLARTTLIEIETRILNDLQQAIDLLPAEYATPNRVTPNKYTAMALRSRIYLYTKQWQLAENNATTLINATLYTLNPNLANVFLPASTETIWQLLPVLLSSNTAEGSAFIPSSATLRPAYILTPQLLAAFENNDARKTAWLKTNTISGTAYTYPFKYKVRSGTTKTEYNIVFRLAEHYLIRAEARAEQNNLTGALSDLNLIRSRASLPPTSAITKDEILAAIDKERRIELFAEWGHRWHDLIRKQKTSAVLAPLKAGWNNEDILYPIPLLQLTRNPFLTQNPGY